MKTGLIYKATSPSGKCYIGKTTESFRSRKVKHKHAALTARIGYPFYHAIRHYGWDKITWEILYSNVPLDQVDTLEQQCIEKYHAYTQGYNCTKGGEGQLERKFSELSIEKMKQNHWSRTKSQKELADIKQRISNGSAKLTIQQKETIREKYKTGKYTHKALSLEYHVSASLITMIIGYKR